MTALRVNQLLYRSQTKGRTDMKKNLLLGILAASVFVFSGGAALSDDLDCFDGSCGGSKGIPR